MRRNQTLFKQAEKQARLLAKSELYGQIQIQS